jgi:hypothetical protein
MTRPRKFLLGPIQEWEDAPPSFVSAYGTKTTFRVDVIWAEEVADLQLSRTQARFELGAEVFNDERALLNRALALWPNAQTKEAMRNYEASAALADALNAAGLTPDTVVH